jgi:hypothetical protein
MIDDDSGAVGGMRNGRGNRSARRKPAKFHFVHHKSNMTWPVLEPKPSTNCRSYGRAHSNLCTKITGTLSREIKTMDKLFLRNLIHASFSISGLLDSVSPCEHRRRVVQAAPGALTSEDAATDDLPSSRYRSHAPWAPCCCSLHKVSGLDGERRSRFSNY